MKHRLPWDCLDRAEKDAIWANQMTRLRRIGARLLLAELGCQRIAVTLDAGRLVVRGDFDDKHLWLLGCCAAEVAELLQPEEETISEKIAV